VIGSVTESLRYFVLSFLTGDVFSLELYR